MEVARPFPIVSPGVWPAPTTIATLSFSRSPIVCSSCSVLPSLLKVGVWTDTRKCDSEGCSLPSAGALRAHGSTVHLYEMAHDRKSEPEPSLLSRERAVSLTKAIKHVGKESFWYAFARVADRYQPVRSNLFEPDLDAAAGGRELDRIGEQVPDNLLKPARIARYEPQRFERKAELDSLCLYGRPHCLDRSLDDRAQIDWPDFELELTGDNP